MLIFKLFLNIIFFITHSTSFLQKQLNEFRDIRLFSGIWKFYIYENKNLDDVCKDYIPMPVPSSFNDITLFDFIKNHVGWVKYSQSFTMPKQWILREYKYILKFESVNYYANITVNGKFIGIHEGGHLPFEYDVSIFLLHGNYSKCLNIDVLINNTLNHDTIPQADYVYINNSIDLPIASDKAWFNSCQEPCNLKNQYYHPRGYAQQTLLFDYFNYAGIHRDVSLLKIPKISIDDITITTSYLRMTFLGDFNNDVLAYRYTFDQSSKSGNRKYVKYDLVQAQTHSDLDSASIKICIIVNNLTKENLKEYRWEVDITVIPDERYSSSQNKDGIAYNHDTELVKLKTRIKPTFIQPSTIDVADTVDESGSLNFTTTIVIKEPRLWWPHTMKPLLKASMTTGPGYLYTLRCQLIRFKQHDYKEFVSVDEYFQTFGIRTLEISSHISHVKTPSTNPQARNKTEFIVNGLPFYFRGFGWHEDLPTIGRAHSSAHSLSDFYRIIWLGANSFRTSHYPYDEEVMDLCDRFGIVVINELPAVGVRFFNAKTLKLHKQMARELIARDKNRPSTFVWSLANEPRSALPESEPYFKELASSVRSLDPTRYVTAVLYEPPGSDLIGQFMDIICINQYFGWYDNVAKLNLITNPTIKNINSYANGYPGKPIIITEYGAETIQGQHSYPPKVFSEEYQSILFNMHHLAFDAFIMGNIHFNNLGEFEASDTKKTDSCISQAVPRPNGLFDFEESRCIIDDMPLLGNNEKPSHYNLVGEMFWNFIDFESPEKIDRVGGCNRKGVFSRDRTPKMSAHTIRKRYWRLAQQENKNVLLRLNRKAL